jgi:hypothetical protein
VESVSYDAAVIIYPWPHYTVTLVTFLDADMYLPIVLKECNTYLLLGVRADVSSVFAGRVCRWPHVRYL